MQTIYLGSMRRHPLANTGIPVAMLGIVLFAWTASAAIDPTTTSSQPDTVPARAELLRSPPTMLASRWMQAAAGVLLASGIALSLRTRRRTEPVR